MLDTLPTASDISTMLAALLQNPELREGIEDGHQAFFDEYEESDESWRVDELTELVDKSSLVSTRMEKAIVDAYVIDTSPARIDWTEITKNREHYGQNMFYYGLGFLLGFIDQGLRPDEE